jgi:hypothetical protein
MSCGHGQIIHKEFEAAVDARIEVEARSPRGAGRNPNGEVKAARKNEDVALMKRTFHISGCEHCYTSPPRSQA